MGQGLQHSNLSHAAVPPSLHSRGMQSVEKTKHRMIGTVLGE